MNNNDEKFIKKLFSESLKYPSGKCPSEEDISALVDGVLKEDEKNDLMKHISKCSRCYEVYTTVLDLTGKENNKKLRVFSSFSIAASIFIAVISLIIFYKINVEEKADLVNKFGESAGIVVKPLPAESKDSSIKEKLKKKVDRKHGPDDKRSKSPAKIVDEDITTVEETVKKRKEKPELKSEKLPAVKSYKIKEEIPEERMVLRSVLSKKEVLGYSRQGRGKDSNIKPAGIETQDKEKSKAGKRKRVPEIKKMIHLSDIDGYSEVTTGEKIRVEFELKKDGTIKRICVLYGGEGRMPLIIKALSGWVFSPAGMEHLRFTVDLFLNEKGKFKVLK